MTQRFISAAKYVMRQINPANLSGAIDVVIVEQEDGSLLCSPFHVRFGKLGTLVAEGRPVDVYINGELVPDMRMKLGNAGEAFFVEERPPEAGGVLTSPITSDVEEEEVELEARRLRRTHSLSDSPLPDISRTPPSSTKKRRRTVRRSQGEEEPHLSIRCFSDDDLCTDVFNDSAARFLSDPALDKTMTDQESGEGLTWQWGELPVEEHVQSSRRKRRYNRRVTVAVIPHTEHSDSDTGSDEAAEEAEDEDEEEKDHGNKVDVEKEKWEPETTEVTVHQMNGKHEPEEGKEKSEEEAATFYVEDSKPNEPIYLSEVIERPELQELYVYRRPPDGAPREGAVSPVDQGYRSDGEGSPATGWPTAHQSSPPSPGRVTEEESGHIFPVRLSLCGMTEVDGPHNEQVDAEKFHARMVLYEEFCKDPEGILNNPELVVALNGKHYSWPVAAPLVMASLVYQSELPPRVVERMIQNQEAKRENKRRGSYFSRLTGWGRSRPAQQPTPPSLAVPESNSTSSTIKFDTEPPSNEDSKAEEAPIPSSDLPSLLHFKTLRLSSAQLQKLKLNPGANTVEYRVTSQFQGTARCHARIFLWHWRDRVVVSDIDGTITQSDVMGQLGPFLGKDVSQRGVASLYTNIASNRYRVLYLSSRAIGQAHWTRNYLDSVVQERGVKLPEGPVLLSPTSLLYALVREIRNRPEDFKIPCLKDVRSLFPESVNPFYAGFGNKVNDVRSYEAVDINPERIFIVDTTGALKKHSHVAYKTSYSNLGELVHHFFPERLTEKDSNQFSNFAYWRTPVKTVD